MIKKTKTDFHKQPEVFFGNFVRKFLFILLFGVLVTQSLTAQIRNDFDIRYQADVRGELTFIANNIVNRYQPETSSNQWVFENGTFTVQRVVTPAVLPNQPYNNVGTASDYNSSFDMRYIDVDTDPTTFSSSSATLTFSDVNCSQIRYAGLYWAGIYTNSDRSTIDDIKFRLPGGNYIDITADELLYDGYGDPVFGDYSPYAAYKDVTHLVAALANPTGEYFVANVRADNGYGPMGGVSGGWKMVVVYENPGLPNSKFITTFDGYAGIDRNQTLDIPVSGFTTLPAPFSVRANLGVAALEGDNIINGDVLQINANGTFNTLSNDQNPSTNFFNSTISLNNTPFTARNPNSLNTLGWDVDLFEVPNGGVNNTVIPNDATSAILRASSAGDRYDIFFASFDVDIIAPDIVIEKNVQTPGGDDITGQGVQLGQTIDYVLTFDNIGNDHGTGFTIRDVLPINVSPPNGRTNFVDADFSLPNGVTYTFDPLSRELVFSIPDSYVRYDNPAYAIRFRVVVSDNCLDFLSACSTAIENIAYGTYRGVENTDLISDDPSVPEFNPCGLTLPGTTNFLIDDLSNCNFTRTTELCGDSMLLTAGAGFDNYEWYSDTNANGVLDAADTRLNDGDPDANQRTFSVTSTGVYIVNKMVAAPCTGSQEIIRVEPSTTINQQNPIVDYFNLVSNDTDPFNNINGLIAADCVDASPLPLFYLCGSNDALPLQVNILDAQELSWELLDEGTCTTPTAAECANKALTCTGWSQVQTGNSYTVTTAGKYRLVVTSQNGCTNRYFFNVFQNNLDIRYTQNDILCDTDGNITITNIGAGYGYQLVDDTTGAVRIPFSANNGPSFNFSSGENGSYRVEITQLDTNGDPIANACIFTTPVIGVRDRDVVYNVDVTGQTCDDLATIAIEVQDAEAPYNYEIRRNDGSNGGQGSLVDSAAGETTNRYVFSGLTPGNYIASVTSQSGCSFSEEVTINYDAIISLEARVSQHITCREGNILMSPIGEHPQHTFAIWSYVNEAGNAMISYPSFADIPASNFQTRRIFDILDPGDYTFVVLDRQGCYVLSNEVSIEFQPAADFNPTVVTDVNCFGEATGSIRYDLVNDNGYTLQYTLFDQNNQPLASNASGNFSNLGPGDYRVVINQTRGGTSCDYEELYQITAPTTALSGEALLTQEYTCLQNGVIVAQNVTGGIGPYAYSLDGINFIPDTTPNANRFENLVAGSYAVYIRDAANCVFTTNTIAIPALNPPTDITVSATQITCADPTVNLTVASINGGGVVQYEITAPTAIAPSSASGGFAIFNNLDPNTYTIRVTDSQGCFYEENYTVAPIVPINIVATGTSPIRCMGANDGSIRFDVTYNATQEFTYTLSGPSGILSSGNTTTSIDATNVSEGSYVMELTETATGCTYSTTYALNGPTASLSYTSSVVQPTCITEGSAAITATGGWGGYTYSLVNPDGSAFGQNSTGSFTNLLQAGTYTGTIVDANQCQIPFSFVLNQVVGPVLALDTNEDCYNDAILFNLIATITSGGDGNFEYSLNGGAFSTNNVFNNVVPGTYTVTVIDGNACTDTETFTVYPELSLTASARPIAACSTFTNVDITAAGGDGNYVYAIVPRGATPTTTDFLNTNPYSVTDVGSYDIYVRDNNGNSGYCEVLIDIDITQDPALSLNVSNTPILCSGELSTLTIAASGGEPPYRYSIDNGNSYQTTSVFENVTAGNYPVIVRDNNACEIALTQTITEPFTLSSSASVVALAECNPLGAEVRITNPIGGTPPYVYSFDGGTTFTSNAIGYLSGGTHTVYTRDSNNCMFSSTLIVDALRPEPTLTANVTYECDGEAEVIITPSDPSFTYSSFRLNSVENAPDPASNVFTNVPVGTQNFSVSYVSSLPPSRSYLLTETFGSGVNTSITEIDPAYCYEPQDGTESACGFGFNTQILDGEYSVTNRIVSVLAPWRIPNNHTGDIDGRYLAINVGGVAGLGGIIYAKRNIEVIPNRDVTISLYAFNLFFDGEPGADPSIEIQLVDPAGTVIASTITGNVPKNLNADDWHNYLVNLNPGANSNLDIVIRTNSNIIYGNDICIDDIEAYQIPEECPRNVSVDVVIENGNSINASVINYQDLNCIADNSGSITFEVTNFGAAGFEYSFSSDFSAIVGSSTVGQQTLSGLAAGTYDVYIRDVANPIAACSTRLTQIINEPTALSVSNTPTQPTCSIGGSVIIAASGGSGGYSYQIQQPNGTLLGPQSSANFTGLNQVGTHTITVTDSNGCISTDTFNLVSPTLPSLSIDASSDLCVDSSVVGSASVVLAAAAGSGIYSYNINGGAYRASNTFPNLSPATYVFGVRDSNGCTDTVSLTVEPQMTAMGRLVKDLDCSASPEAVLQLFQSGGYAPYTYELNINGAGYNAYTGPNPYITSTPGTYRVRITDSQGCTIETNIVTVTIPENLLATASITEPSCNGASNGVVEINVDPSFGVSPYEISFNGGTFTNQQVYTGLAAGTYSYTVRDAKQCIFTSSATLTDPVLFDANVVATDVSCSGSVEVLGSIDVSITSGGSPNFTYTLYDNLNNIATTTSTNPVINTTATSVSFDGLTFGDYYIRIIDANGCEFYQNPVRVLSSPNLSLQALTPASDCISGGSVDLLASGGSGNYDFSIFGSTITPDTETPISATEEVATFNGLNPGQNYVFQVIDTGTNCASYVEVAIPAVSAIDVFGAPLVTNASCFGQTDGAIQFQLDGYHSSITAIYYELRERVSNIPVSGYSGTITAPIITDPLGPGPTPVQTLTSIPPGDYVLFFREMSGTQCSNSFDFRIIEPNPVEVRLIDQNDGTCNVDANVTVLASGGNGTYTYAFVQDGTAPVASDYTTNNYATLDPSVNTDWDVYVRDQNGCTTTSLDITVVEAPSPTIAASVLNTCTANEGDYTIEISLDALGVAPYSLSLNGGSFQNVSFTTVGSTHQFTNLSSGIYNIQIRDFNGCGNTVTAQIYAPSRIATEVLNQPSCLVNDGQIQINAFGGSSNFRYELFSSGLSVTGGSQTSPIFSGLDHGLYTAYLYDQTTSCTKSIDVVLEAPTAVAFTTNISPVSCFGASDGTIIVELAVGMDNAPYTYQLFVNSVAQGPPQNSNIFTNLTANDDYIVQVVSSRNCELSLPSPVSSPDPIANVNATVVPFSCVVGNTDGNAVITVDTASITGGSGNYTSYRFYSDRGTASTADDIEQIGSSSQLILTNRAGGLFTITVFDDNGCSATISETVLPFDAIINTNATITNNITCNPGNDAEITITASTTSGDMSLLEFSIDNGANYQSSNVFSGLAVGTYNFLTRHTLSGCVLSTTVAIAEPNTFTIDVVKTSDVICFGTNTGEVTFELLDAAYSNDFTWEILTAAGTSVLTGTQSGNGPTPVINIGAGTYDVRVTQSSYPFCTNTQRFSILGPTAPLTGASLATPITCVPGADGIITASNVSGGWGGYTYYVGTNAPTAATTFVSATRFTNLTAGTYQMWVQDVAGCQVFLGTHTLTDPIPITGDIRINQENCTNLEGELEVINVANGQGSNYTYQLRRNGTNFRASQGSPIFSGLGAGRYDVVITDQWGCSRTTAEELLFEQMNLTTTVVKPIDCSATPGGTIRLDIAGGSANIEYTVVFPDGITQQTNISGLFINLDQAGVYTFTATDLETSNPICSISRTQLLDNPVNPVLRDAQITNVSCIGGSDGTLTAVLDSATSTNPVYQYVLYAASDIVNPIAGPQNNPLFANLPSGQYQIRVISGRGCQDVKNETITEPTALTVQATATEFTCDLTNRLTAPIVTVNASGGTTLVAAGMSSGDYLYSIDGSNYQNENTFTIADTGVVQNITTYVIDGNGCMASDMLTIQPYNAFGIAVNQDTAISCTNDERVIVTVTDNGLPHTYNFELLPVGNTNAILVSSTTTSATFDLSAVGAHNFRVTDVATGCYVDAATYDIAPYNFIDVTATATTAATCFGDNSGVISIAVSGYTGAYSYEVYSTTGSLVIPATAATTATNPLEITGLSGGAYVVRITEAANPFCVEESNVVFIASPSSPLTVGVSVLAAATCTNNRGEIGIRPQGGFAPYDVLMTNTLTGQVYTTNDVQETVFGELPAGNYAIEITDNVGCTSTNTVRLDPATPLVANAIPLVTSLACYEDTNATITVTNQSGGSGSYGYQLNYYDEAGVTIQGATGIQNNPVFSNLGAGIYSVTVVDGWNCDIETNQVEIESPAPITASVALTNPLTCTTGAIVELYATGGSGMYEYSTDNVSFVPMTTNPIRVPETGEYPAGTYQFYLRDAVNGCMTVVSNAITEEAIEPLQLEVDRSAAFLNCFSENTAIIRATASGGMGNYEFELFTDASLSDVSRISGPVAQGEFTDLGAGTYYVSVVSGDCTTTVEEVVLTEPTSLTYTEDIRNITCIGENDGQISVTLSGGAGGYQYAISPNLSRFDTINTFTDLAPGDYSIIAQDQNGCYEFLTYSIVEPALLEVVPVVNSETCVDAQDGTIRLEITGGTAPYSTALNANSDADFVADRVQFDNMEAGNYLVFVRDANGCEANLVVDIETGVNLSAVIEPIYICEGDTPGNYLNITLENSDVLGDVLYAIDSIDPEDLQLYPDFRNTAPGNHYVTISHANGCIQTIDFEIEDFAPLSIVLEQRNLNEITALVEGGLEGYTYFFNGIDNGDNAKFFVNSSGTYEVRVVDANGCEAVASILMEFVDADFPKFFTPDGDGLNDFWTPSNTEQYPAIIIKIFDRYGRVLSEQSADTKGWDGTYDGKDLPTGDYWYVIKLNGERDDREFVGNFTLYR